MYIIITQYLHLNTINNIPIFENFSPDINLYTRHSKDSVLSTRGKTLNELCIHTGLRILNGRISGDIMGEFTCFTPNGVAVLWTISYHLKV
jgi:hypothetical protein